jgi:hypothetical protein
LDALKEGSKGEGGEFWGHDVAKPSMISIKTSLKMAMFLALGSPTQFAQQLPIILSTFGAVSAKSL